MCEKENETISEGNIFDQSEKLIFRKCYSCEGKGKVATIDNKKPLPLSFMPHVLSMGAAKIDVMHCDECSGRGRVLTAVGLGIAEILEQIPEMAKESTARFKKRQKEREERKDEKDSNPSS